MDHEHGHIYRASGGPSSHNSQNVAGEGHAGQNNNYGSKQQVNFGPGPQINDHRSGTHYHGNVINVDDDVDRGLTKRDKVMQDLHRSFYEQAKNRNPVRVPHTCEWFVQHRLFQHWCNSQTSNMLWVSADPGSGKSVLARYLIDSVLPDSNSTVCYFFFKDDFDDQKSAKNAISCILHQLFTQRPELLSDTIIDRMTRGAGFEPGSTHDLWDILKKALSITRESTSQQHLHQQNTGPAHSIVCIIDAFDECSSNDQSIFSDILCTFYLSVHVVARESNFKLKFLITSRPYKEIRMHFHDLLQDTLPEIHLDGDAGDEKDKIEHEIGIFIEAKVDDLAAKFLLRRYAKETLLLKLKSVPNRTYLWVYLTLDWVENELEKDDAKDIAKIISRLPPNVHSAYDLILAKSLKPEKAKKLLHIIVAATRPLSLEEMHIALAIEPYHKAYDRFGTAPDSSTTIPAFDKKWFCEHVRNLCGLFVTIVDAKLYLLHQTAKEFLVADTAGITTVNTETYNNNPHNSFKAQLTWKSSLQPLISHEVLFQICAWHLNFDAIKAYPIPTSNDVGDFKNSVIISEHTVNHPFFSYSARNWSHHLFASQLQEDTETVKSLVQVPDTTPDRTPPWFEIWYFENNYGRLPRGFTSLMIASCFGLDEIVEVLLQDPDIDVNAKCYKYEESALSMASKLGFDDVVEVLLAGHTIQDQQVLEISRSKMIDVDSTNSCNRTPLHMASMNGHTRIVRLLIDAGANVNAVDEYGDGPLSKAVWLGKKDVLELLLRAGANVNAVDEYGDWPLSEAVWFGDSDVLELLLRAGANVDAVDNFGRTPLSLSVMKRDKDILELLLRAGASVDTTDALGWSPLMFAVSLGRTEFVKILLSAGADVRVKADSGRSALSRARDRGFAGIVRILCDAGAVE